MIHVIFKLTLVGSARGRRSLALGSYLQLLPSILKPPPNLLRERLVLAPPEGIKYILGIVQLLRDNCEVLGVLRWELKILLV